MRVWQWFRKYVVKYNAKSDKLYDISKNGKRRQISEIWSEKLWKNLSITLGYSTLPEIPYGAHGNHEGKHDRNVDSVVEVLEKIAPIVLKYRLQILGDEEGVDGVAADLSEADEHVDDLAHERRKARPEAARVQERRLPSVRVVQERHVGAPGWQFNSFFWNELWNEFWN